MQHDRATDHAGKKVVIIGACTSGNIVVPWEYLLALTATLAHDIATDYADHGVGECCRIVHACAILSSAQTLPCINATPPTSCRFRTDGRCSWEVCYQHLPLPFTTEGSGIGVYDETGPPSDVADRLNASFSNMMRVPIYQSQIAQIAEMDKYVHNAFLLGSSISTSLHLAENCWIT